ncbi:MAG: hypothetical protein Q8P67_00125 [archaeon]|nr:hypothetical protein [archaeon]
MIGKHHVSGTLTVKEIGWDSEIKALIFKREIRNETKNETKMKEKNETNETKRDDDSVCWFVFFG